MIATAFLIVAAAICNAVMDKLAHHYGKSIFAELAPRFWNPNISWKNKYIGRDPAKGHRKVWVFNFPVTFTDAWHLFKSLMLAFMIGSIVCYSFAGIWWAVSDFLFLGGIWILTFNLFYNILLAK